MPLEYLDKINSTNEFVKSNLANFKSNFSGVYTFNQTNGKGVRGNSWESEANKNIALTFCLCECNTSIYCISFWVAVILRKFIEYISQKTTFIKWPNDIRINDKKICGILIEKVKNIFVIGIGINVLQTNFNNLPNASSLINESNKNYYLKELVENLITSFENSFNLLLNESLILKEYNFHLYGKNKILKFKINNDIKKGIIQNVNNHGEICILLDNFGVLKFKMKEIEFLY